VVVSTGKPPGDFFVFSLVLAGILAELVWLVWLAKSALVLLRYYGG
jgi:hypothetical protein